jgi:hypothetical protein
MYITTVPVINAMITETRIPEIIPSAFPELM